MKNIPDVFISYSSKDEEIAITLYEALKKRNIMPWLALYDIDYGTSYAKEIINAIKNSKIFSVIISSNSNKSFHVKNEIELATRQIYEGIKILPILIDDDKMDDDIEYFLCRQQWLDASHPPIQEKIDKYCNHICHLLGIADITHINNLSADIFQEKDVLEEESENIELIKEKNKEIRKNIINKNSEILEEYKRYALQGDFNTAIGLLEKEIISLKKSDDINEYQLSLKLNDLGIYYRENNNCEKALQSFSEALDYAPAHGEPWIYSNIASVYMILKDYKSAVQNYTQSLTLQRVEFGNYQPYTLEARSIAFHELGDYDKSLEDFIAVKKWGKD